MIEFLDYFIRNHDHKIEGQGNKQEAFKPFISNWQMQVEPNPCQTTISDKFYQIADQLEFSPQRLRDETCAVFACIDATKPPSGYKLIDEPEAG